MIDLVHKTEGFGGLKYFPIEVMVEWVRKWALWDSH